MVSVVLVVFVRGQTLWSQNLMYPGSLSCQTRMSVDSSISISSSSSDIHLQVQEEEE